MVFEHAGGKNNKKTKALLHPQKKIPIFCMREMH
jgi:hypothetical protein